MASYLYRTRGMLQFPRYVPTLIARAQASQNNSTPFTPGQGVPMSGSTKTVSQTGGTKAGDSSVLPKSSTSTDHTNPTKTSSDAPSLDHDNVDVKNKSTDKQSRTTSSSSSKSSSSSSGSDSNQQKSFLSTPVGQFGTLALLTITIYASYKMISGGSSGGDNKSLKQNEHYKRATADYQASNTQGTDVKK